MINYIWFFLFVGSFIPCQSQVLTEIPSARTLAGKVYAVNDSVRIYSSSLTTVHYDSLGTLTEVDFTPQRINNAQFDGWRIRTAWEFLLGQPNGETDGWVSFGDRQGNNRFAFTSESIGWIHGPSKTWQDIGGAANYDRANLSRTNVEKVVAGLDTIIAANDVEWRNIWTTPNGGESYIKWVARGDGLKEVVVIDSLARVWIKDNRPPDSTATESFLSFRFRLDLSQTPRVFKNNVEMFFGNDIDDSTTANIELRTAGNALFAFMPAGNISVNSDAIDYSPPNRPERNQFTRPLRKVFYRQGGTDFMFIGIRADRVNNMLPGDLEFDPTSGPTAIANNVDDGENVSGTWNINGCCSNIIYNVEVSDTNDEYGGFSWTLPTIPSSATIDSMYMSITTQADNNGALVIRIGIEDSDPATAVIWSTSHNQTGPSETWIETVDATSTTYANDTAYWGLGDTAPYLELAQGLTDLLSSYGDITSGDRINIGTWPPNVNDTDYMGIRDFNEEATTSIFIRWTLAGGARRRGAIF